MRIRFALLIVILTLCFATTSMTDQVAITEDGRKVLLNDDGTWIYVKTEQEQKERPATYSTGNYIRTGSIGSVPAQEKKKVTRQGGDFPFRKIESWVGEKFIFLPIGEDYKLLKGKEDESYKPFDVATWFMNLPYKEYVGRIAKVRSASKENPAADSAWFIELEMVDTNEKLYAKTRLRELSGIGPVADIDKARELWLGKDLWCARESMTLSTFDEDTKKIGSVPVWRYFSLNVTDIVAGESNKKPVRFILRTAVGETGYVDMDLSGTNASNVRKASPLADTFFVENPRKNGWSERAWLAIMGSKVFIGMTSEQARMSRGKPGEINKTITGTTIHEQWVYGTGTYLYFEDGVLTSIQQ